MTSAGGTRTGHPPLPASSNQEDLTLLALSDAGCLGYAQQAWPTYLGCVLCAHASRRCRVPSLIGRWMISHSALRAVSSPCVHLPTAWWNLVCCMRVYACLYTPVEEQVGCPRRGPGALETTRGS